jgi:hypothetical protein
MAVESSFAGQMSVGCCQRTFDNYFSVYPAPNFSLEEFPTPADRSE